ncbi:hypothetical protein HPG69_012581, partial [Diceros bicornis minor]
RIAPSPQSLGLLFIYIVSFLISLPANLLALWAFMSGPPHAGSAALQNRRALGGTVCALIGCGFYSGTTAACGSWWASASYATTAWLCPCSTSCPSAGVWRDFYLVSWILSFRHCSVVIIVQLPTDNTMEQLDMVLPVWLDLCLILFFIPMAVAIFCYWCIVHIMLSRPQVGTQKHWRAIGLSTVSVFNFLVCLGPSNVSHVVEFFPKRRSSWQVCVVLPSVLNAHINPLIIDFSSSAVHKVFDKRLQRLKTWGAHCQGAGGEEMESQLQREETGA